MGFAMKSEKLKKYQILKEAELAHFKYFQIQKVPRVKIKKWIT